MDLVLGVSMEPATVRMVLVDGDNPDGALVEEESLGLASDREQANLSRADQVMSAILGTREGASEAGCRLLATGVSWADPQEAAALRAALAARKIENVMLVSAFLAAAALAQNAGSALGYTRIAMLLVEPDSATVAVVNCHDGAVRNVHRTALSEEDGRAIVELAAVVSDIEALEPRPEGLFVVGSGVDVTSLMAVLEAATWLPVSAAEEPQTALARGAALASAHAPLFASSTAALAYAQDPGTGEGNRYVPAGYFPVSDVSAGGESTDGVLAYSAVSGEDADAEIPGIDAAGDDGVTGLLRGHSPVLLGGAVLAVIAVTAAAALEIALGIGTRPTVALRPTPGQELIVPDEEAPASASVPPRRPPQPTNMAMSRPPVPVRVPAPPAPSPPAAVPLPAPTAPPAPVPAASALVPIPVPAPAQPPAALVPRERVPLPATPLRSPAPPSPVQLREAQPPIRAMAPPAQPPAPSLPVSIPPAQPPAPLVRVSIPPAQPPAPKLPGHLPANDPPVNRPAPRPAVDLAAPVHISPPEPPPVRTTPIPAVPELPRIIAPRVAPRVQAPPLSPGGAFGGAFGDHGPGAGRGWGFGSRGFGGGGFAAHR